MSNPLFAYHKLNLDGQKKAKRIAECFEQLVTELNDTLGPLGPKGEGVRELAITRTKLEEACFFAKKSLAVRPENQENES